MGHVGSRIERGVPVACSAQGKERLGEVCVGLLREYRRRVIVQKQWLIAGGWHGPGDISLPWPVQGMALPFFYSAKQCLLFTCLQEAAANNLSRACSIEEPLRVN